VNAVQSTTASSLRPATVRVFLCTYRRHELLPRALASLRAQTFTDWVCELHNDAPDDPFPAKLAAEIGDARVTVITHEKNLGGIGTFNLMFDPRPERYISLLEDDNWWQPDFLDRMVAAMDAHPEAKVGWANMRIWQEEPAGGWTDTDQLVWPRAAEAPVELFHWPHPQQAWHSLHSTGSMLVRTGALENLKLPLQMRFDFADPARERAMPHPLLFMPQPLVNFSLTLGTARTARLEGLPEHYVMMLASFFRHVRADDETVRTIWAAARSSKVRATDKLFLAALAAPECRPLLRHARIKEWLLFVLAQLRRPRLCWRALHAPRYYPELWNYLDRHTRARCTKSSAP
jgi:glycosyltransferase involved in cell wall biosynthesis